MTSRRTSPWIRKPLHVVYEQEAAGGSGGPSTGAGSSTATNYPARHLSLYDLLAIGVGGTVGSGIFVLTGQIAANSAGPACFFSFALAGVAAVLSGVSYAELSARISVAGSTYQYAYVCLGEMSAVIAAALLTLEYGVAGAAVARSWGDKVVLWLEHLLNHNLVTDDAESSASALVNVRAWLEPDIGGGVQLQLPAMLVSAGSTALLYAGVHESKQVTNFITALKMVLVLFMVTGGFFLFQRDNMRPPLAPFGVQGVLRGATSSFFGYLGYDEVCAVAGEALHPARDMPRAVLGTLVIVTVCYILAALSLTGMQHYSEINPTSGFPDAFSSRGVEWAAQIAAVGEVVTLPVVVLISLLAQPRLTMSMAHDGLLPKLFAHVDPATGSIQGGTLVSGVCMTLIATFCPFTYLDDLISAGILVAFSMTNSCLILLRCESPLEQPKLLPHLLVVYNILCFGTALLSSHQMTWLSSTLQPLCTTMAALATVTCLFYMAQACPQSTHFGGSILRRHDSNVESTFPSSFLSDSDDNNSHDSDHGRIGTTNGPGSSSLPSSPHSSTFFQTPYVPYLPATGMFVNWYLIAQLEATAMLWLALYLGVTVSLYLAVCAPYSVGHTTRGWSRNNATGTTASGMSTSRYEAVGVSEEEEHEYDEDGAISMSVFSESVAPKKTTPTARRGSDSGVVS
jgi:amino acid transporter